MSSPSRPISILIAAETGLAYGRGVTKGVINYANRQGSWSIILAAFEGLLSQLAAGSRPTGLIVQSATADDSRAIREMKIPAVNISDAEAGHPIPTVISDNKAIARRAVEHLCSRGIRNLAFSGPLHEWYASQRLEGFRQALADAGIAEPVFVHNPGVSRVLRRGLDPLLKAAPRPLGIVAAHDFVARSVVNAAFACGLRVPEDVAIVGIDNDDLLCEMSKVPLSSVDVSAERIGFEAAAILDRLMAGQSADPGPYLIPPKSVVVRQSSKTLAIEDEHVAAAIRFIEANLSRPLGVEDILDESAITISRRQLEQRFKTALGRSPAAEIRRLRIEQAKELMDTTDLPLSQVATRTGFPDISFLGKAFRRETGMTATQYRRRTRPQAQAD